jgi:hypothetical protein
MKKQTAALNHTIATIAMAYLDNFWVPFCISHLEKSAKSFTIRDCLVSESIFFLSVLYTSGKNTFYDNLKLVKWEPFKKLRD